MKMRPSEGKQGLVSPSLEFTKLQWKDLRKERDIQEQVHSSVRLL